MLRWELLLLWSEVYYGAQLLLRWCEVYCNGNCTGWRGRRDVVGAVRAVKGNVLR